MILKYLKLISNLERNEIVLIYRMLSIIIIPAIV